MTWGKFWLLFHFLTLWEPVYDMFVLQLRPKKQQFRLPYIRPRSSADCPRELFKGSNGSASLVLQPLRWCCIDCVIHHERDVREEQHRTYVWCEKAIIDWSWHVISIVAYCHSAKLCTYAARNFRSQQNGAVTRMWRSCGVQPSKNVRSVRFVVKSRGCCCNLSGRVALIVWFTTNGMCVKNNTIHICGANKQ